MRISAVLTADIVNSSLLPITDMEDLSRAIKHELHDCNPPVHFYRGDGFNVMVSPDQALKVAAILRSMTRSYKPRGVKEFIDIRIAIGIGPVEEPVESMASGKGDAFIMSGRELDIITSSGQRLAIRCFDEKAEIGFKAMAGFADYILTRLSAKQAQAILKMLQGANEKETALFLNKKQPTINKLKKAALWDELEQIFSLYQKLILTLDSI